MPSESEVRILPRETPRGWVADVQKRDRILFTSPPEKTRGDAKRAAEYAARLITTAEGEVR